MSKHIKVRWRSIRKRRKAAMARAERRGESPAPTITGNRKRRKRVERSADHA